LSKTLSVKPFLSNFLSSLGEIGRKLNIMGTSIMATITCAIHQKVQDKVIFWRIWMGVKAMSIIPMASVVMAVKPGTNILSITLLQALLPSFTTKHSSVFLYNQTLLCIAFNNLNRVAGRPGGNQERKYQNERIKIIPQKAHESQPP